MRKLYSYCEYSSCLQIIPQQAIINDTCNVRILPYSIKRKYEEEVEEEEEEKDQEQEEKK